MGREVRRVPMNWQHPTEFREQWDRTLGQVRMMEVSKPLFQDYADSLLNWEESLAKVKTRTGWEWDFWLEYCVTGYKGADDEVETLHPFEDGTVVRDEDHLHELLIAHTEARRPDPDDYMPDFSDVPDDQMGIVMYETTSEGTPISPAFLTPEELARWLTDTGASSFGDMTATYEQWLSVAHGGWAPSAVVTSGRLISGVEAMNEPNVTL